MNFRNAKCRAVRLFGALNFNPARLFAIVAASSRYEFEQSGIKLTLSKTSV
jgi:hypothetical protein